MTLILVQVIAQSVSSTLQWLDLYVGIRALPKDRAHQRRWITGSGLMLAAWFLGVVLLAADNAFRNDIVPPRIPLMLLATLIVGYLLLLSGSFRRSRSWVLVGSGLRMGCGFALPTPNT